MNIFDMHCDTVHEALIRNLPVYENNLHIDFKRMSEYGSYSQFFVIWLENEEKAWENFEKKAELLDSEIKKNSMIVQKCLSYGDMKNAHKNGKIAAFMSLEGAYMTEKTEDVDYIFEKGVRCVNLTWNPSSRLAGGVEDVGRLTELGKLCIERMEKLGMIIDVSHLNEESFWDVANTVKKPFIASHSNSKTLCSHNRNLTDEQFKVICRSGGAAGINFYDIFLKDDGGATIDDIIYHIKHFIKIGGDDFVGLGSDFDGVSKLPEGIVGIQSMKNIVEALEKNGFSENTIDKITHLNFERVIKECVG